MKNAAIDITGQRFGRLVCLGFSHRKAERQGTRAVWKFICDCGKTIYTNKNDVVIGKSKSCGCLANELTQVRNVVRKKLFMHPGDRHNRWTALAFVRKENGEEFWTFKCDCGNTVETRIGHVLRNKSKSCGCLMREMGGANRRHGRSRSSIYDTWCGIVSREDTCDRWKTSFDVFLADAGERPKNCSLQRINKAKGFSPENCQWTAPLSPEEVARHRTIHSRLAIRKQRKKPAFALLCRLRCRLRMFLNGRSKSAQTMELVGCSREFLLDHLLKPFPADIEISILLKTHDIDHIKPCVLFDPRIASDQKACFSWTNLQLLPKRENYIKGSKWNGRIWQKPRTRK